MGADRPDPFGPILARQSIVVLDGGLATALEAAGHALDTPLWSARLVLDAPDAVRAVHTAYLEAGADCITSAGYQASFEGFTAAGLSPTEAEHALRRAVGLALEARDAFWAEPANRVGRARPLVAASAGPYGAYLADGSEYRGRYGVARGVLESFHARRLEVLAASGADVLALETIPSLEEAEVLGELLARVRTPGAWVSFTCRDGARLRDGSPIEEAAAACARRAGVVALGVNCTHPRDVGALLGRLRAVTDLPLVAYPNSGEVYDAASASWRGPGADLGWLGLVSDWVEAGARMVGGCCRVGPDAILELRRRGVDAAARGGEGAV